jgi:ubiquinone/menaquinone biosynthesis C-methylase UbiE
MSDFWENKFKNEGAVWSFEPSDSAFFALEMFRANQITKILIPGFGYGRNAKLFCDAGFEVTGIEISETAIEIARKKGLDCQVHHGSVTSMPFDTIQFEGIFCYALIHLLNKQERRKFLTSCYNQTGPGGLMIFNVSSKNLDSYGTGKLLSKDRYEISPGLKVFFYDDTSVTNEFAPFGMISSRDIEEPVKFMEGEKPLKLKLIICKKQSL